MELQTQMDQAFSNYLKLSKILSSDIMEMSQNESDDESWKRNFIRAVAALIEGDSYCFKQMSAIGIECAPPEITKKEEKALKSGVGFTAIEQIKLVLRATYKMFNLGPPPDFSGKDWESSIIFFNKRHSLMHPKSPSDLEISDSAWPEIHSGANWLIKQHFNITELIHDKYVNKNS